MTSLLLCSDDSDADRTVQSPRCGHHRALAILGAVGEAVLACGADGRIDYMNRCAERLTGWSHAEALGQPVGDVLVLETDPTPHGVDARLRPLPPWGRLPATMRRGDARFRIDGVTTDVRDAAGACDGWVAVFRDVTKSDASMELLRHEATHDRLTGLANRAEFDRRLSRTLARMRDSEATGAVLLLDLDHFKAVNDSGGHAAGDALLAGLAFALGEHLRERDTLARVGGDEFAMIVERCTRAEADKVAAKLVAIAAAFQVRYHDVLYGVGVSVGIAMIDAHTASAEAAVQVADDACYAYKRRVRRIGGE